MSDDERPRPTGWPDGFAHSAANRRALLGLASLRGIKPLKLHELAWREGTASACLAAIREARAGSEGDHVIARSFDPSAVGSQVRACGARVVAPGDDEYLSGLLQLADPPVVLFVRGVRLGALAPRVAVVGARNCTPTGRGVAHDIGMGLGRAGVCVVSGAARGIDAAAQSGALDAAGTSVAVLGGGVDVVYPRSSARLLSRILEVGAIVSEYPPGLQPEPFHFPARNRIVAALSLAVVVVEGTDDSGSMITADHGLELGRQVFAVPGPVTSPLAGAPLGLIREGAAMIRGPSDLLADLGMPKTPPSEATPPPGLDPIEREVFTRLAGRLLPDEVARAADMPLPQALAALMSLEVRGLVTSVGGRFERRSAYPG